MILICLFLIALALYQGVELMEAHRVIQSQRRVIEREHGPRVVP